MGFNELILQAFVFFEEFPQLGDEFAGIRHRQIAPDSKFVECRNTVRFVRHSAALFLQGRGQPI